MKRPKRKRDWVGLKVKTIVDMQHSNGSIPAGTMATVLRNYGGLELKIVPCERCGKGFFIKKVPERDVNIIGQQGVSRGQRTAAGELIVLRGK